MSSRSNGNGRGKGRRGGKCGKGGNRSRGNGPASKKVTSLSGRKARRITMKDQSRHCRKRELQNQKAA